MPQLDTNPLPVGVVCTDTIEQLDPFVPSAAVKEQRRTQRTEQSSKRRRVTRSSATGRMQVALTLTPLMLADLAALSVANLLAAVPVVLAGYASFNEGLFLNISCICLFYVACGAITGLYPATGMSPVLELRQCVVSVFASFGFAMVANATLATLKGSELLIFSMAAALGAFLLPLARLSIRRICSRATWWGENAIIVGSGPQGRAIYRYYSRAPQRGLRPIGVVDYSQIASNHSSSELAGIPYLGSVQRLERLRRKTQARWSIVAPGGCETIDMNEVLSHAGNFSNVLVLPSQMQLPSLWSGSRECAGAMGIHLKDHLQNSIARSAKRLVDMVASAFLLTLLGPFLLAVIVLLKRKDPGPAFYGQTRVGKDGKHFKAWKFRTMVVDADQVLEQYLENDPDMRQEWMEYQKLQNDPRVIAGVGSFLRKSSLDEIPQLWNVLKGDMSLVGPRPCMTSQIGLYGSVFPLYQRVRPGITGLWQVSGRNKTTYDQRVRFDSYYVTNWSPWLDFYILIHTVKTIIFREGAY